MTRKPQSRKDKAPAKRPAKAKPKAKKPGTPKPAKKKANAQSKAKVKSPAKPKTKAKAKAPNAAPLPVHWLVRADTIRKLWLAGGIVLAALVGAEFWVHPHGYFGLDGTFAFNAWYGFVTCVAMVIGAKALGILIKREDTYYGGD